VRIRYGTVCSGIEAASVAWKPLGWEPQWFSEIEPFPKEVLAHHYPGVADLGDMTEVDWSEYRGTVDLVAGGTPCQSFSVAGLRKGLADPRGNLTLEFLRVLEQVRPEWVVWENVPGVMSSLSHDAPDPCPPPPPMGMGRDGQEVETEDEYDSEEIYAFFSFLAGLSELGYGISYRVLDAQYFGVPQRRRRVFVVGHFGDWRRAAAVLSERHGLQGHPAPRREAGAKVAGNLNASFVSRGAGGEVDGAAARHIVPHVATSLCARYSKCSPDSDATQTLVPQAFGGNNTKGPINVSTALNASHTASGRQDFETETFIAQGINGDVAHTLRAEGFDASEDGTGRGQPIVAFDPTQITSKTNRSNPKPGDPCHTLAKGAHAPVAVISKYRARRLTPRECERLQGFTDGYTAIPWRGKKAEECADGPRYKALGNSWAVPVARWIGRRIEAVSEVASDG